MSRIGDKTEYFSLQHSRSPQTPRLNLMAARAVTLCVQMTGTQTSELNYY